MAKAAPAPQPSEHQLHYERPYLYPKQLAAIFDPRRYSFIEASAQPLDTVIQTPSGPQPFGALKIGDPVFTRDGSVTQVTGIFPLGKKPVYRLKFSDGVSTRASVDHLWEVDHYRDGRKVVTTEKLLSLTEGSRKHLRFPIAGSVQYPSKPVRIDPWLLGVLIGDGSICGNVISFSTNDPEIVERVRSAIPAGYVLVQSNKYSWNIVASVRGAGYEKPSIRWKVGAYEVAVAREYVGRRKNRGDALALHAEHMLEVYGDDVPEVNLRAELRALGLLGKKHDEKFVPDLYLRNTIEIRSEILRGIMDTDGSGQSHNCAVIEQTSQRLAGNIEDLVRSLGGVCKTTVCSPRIIGWKTSYRTNIRHHDVGSLFWLKRKSERTASKFEVVRKLVSIERVDDDVVQCISVAHPSQLYLTDDFIVTHNTKAGKAQPLDALVYTPHGPKRMGDVAIGDVVLTPGGSGNVVTIYPQGEREILKVTFSDGAVVEADADHLWEVHQFNQKPVVVTTEQLQAWKPYKLSRTWVPEAGCAQFDAQPVPLDAYLVGALIGDGGLTGESVMFSNEDAEILEAVRAAIPPGHSLKHRSRHDWCISGGTGGAQLREDGTHIQRSLRDLGLAGKGSHEKFVPEVYRYNSREVRVAVLQGILDTDGFVDKHGQPGIEQTSERLAQDIEELVQSLGGTVLTRLRAVNGYRAKDGRFITCRPVWRQVIRMQDGQELFRLDRKRARCTLKRKTGHRMFRSIEFSRRAAAQCIELDTERQLYLTNGMVPTHNTSGCIVWLVEQAFNGNDGQNYWWIAPVSGQADIAFRRCLRAIPAHLRTEHVGIKTITLVNGAVLWFKSADKPDSLYGDDVYAAVFDEASRAKEDAWYAVRSTLTATRGRVRIIGNVKGRKNWFYRMARKAQANDDPAYGYHKITAADAVAAHVLDAEEIEDARRNLPEAVFRELYEAEASDDGGNPFGLQAILGCAIPGGVVDSPPVVWGWDLAKHQDYTVGTALDEYGRVCRFSRFQKGWEETIPVILSETGNIPALVDSTGVGDPILERLQKKRRGVFEGYNFTGPSKQKLMEGLAVAIQQRLVKFPASPGKALMVGDFGHIQDELESFEYEYSRTGVHYSAPEGFHDDCVCSLALAVMHKMHARAPMVITKDLLERSKQVGPNSRRRF